MTSIGWIDFSSEHRDKVRTVLDLLRQRGVGMSWAARTAPAAESGERLPGALAGRRVSNGSRHNRGGRVLAVNRTGRYTDAILVGVKSSSELRGIAI